MTSVTFPNLSPQDETFLIEGGMHPVKKLAVVLIATLFFTVGCGSSNNNQTQTNDPPLEMWNVTFENPDIGASNGVYEYLQVNVPKSGTSWNVPPGAMTGTVLNAGLWMPSTEGATETEEITCSGSGLGSFTATLTGSQITGTVENCVGSVNFSGTYNGCGGEACGVIVNGAFTSSNDQLGSGQLQVGGPNNPGN